MEESLYPLTLDFLNKFNTESTNTKKFKDENGLLETFAKSIGKYLVELSYLQTNEIYITSFCTEIKSVDNYTNKNGLLSQWRAYGGDGGYSIVFNTHILEKLIQLEYKSFQYDSFIFDNVIYSDQEEKYNKELSDQIKRISNFQQETFISGYHQANNLPNSSISKAGYENISTAPYYEAFAKCITRYKHCGFKEEHEARIIAIPLDIKGTSIAEKERKFRNKNVTQVPYIELFRSLDQKLPIEKIIVGPHKDKELRATALRIMLRKTDIEVTVSDIPYIT